MAQKAAKTLAARNTRLLNRTHLTSLSLHLLYLLLHFLFNRPRVLTPYLIFTTPTLAIEFYLERLGRPRYSRDGGSGNTLRSAGEDLDAPGLTEYFWDVIYWTWGCMGAVCIFGDRAWWLWVVVPLYSAWLVYSTFMGFKGSMAGMAGMAGLGDVDGGGEGVESKRQKKMEKRGAAQRVRYR
ncbi:hypothetical protein RJZ56_003800 [Blastomyces dermatitidis]